MIDSMALSNNPYWDSQEDAFESWEHTYKSEHPTKKFAAISIGSEGIKVYNRAGECTRYSIDQFIEAKMYYHTSRKERWYFDSFYIDVLDDGKTKSISFDPLSYNDKGRVVRDLERLKNKQKGVFKSDSITDDEIYQKYEWPLKQFLKRDNIIKNVVGWITLLFLIVGVLGLCTRLFVYQNDAELRIIDMVYIVSFCMVYIMLLFWILIPARDKRFLRNQVSSIELTRDEIIIQKESKIVIPKDDIKLITLYRPDFCPGFKWVFRQLNIHTVNGNVSYYMGLHPYSFKEYEIEDYNKLYRSIHAWSDKNDIECLDDFEKHYI